MSLAKVPLEEQEPRVCSTVPASLPGTTQLKCLWDLPQSIFITVYLHTVFLLGVGGGGRAGYKAGSFTSQAGFRLSM